uniref:Alpha-copaene synthase n=1 Tax=Talaromyces marneffei PM1 TaxID=1077442 RepID=A0A093Y6D7_TALMA
MHPGYYSQGRTNVTEQAPNIREWHTKLPHKHRDGAERTEELTEPASSLSLYELHILYLVTYSNLVPDYVFYKLIMYPITYSKSWLVDDIGVGQQQPLTEPEAASLLAYMGDSGLENILEEVIKDLINKKPPIIASGSGPELGLALYRCR